MKPKKAFVEMFAEIYKPSFHNLRKNARESQWSRDDRKILNGSHVSEKRAWRIVSKNDRQRDDKYIRVIEIRDRKTYDVRPKNEFFH